MVKLTMWIKEKKHGNHVNFDSEDFTAEKIYQTAIELTEEMAKVKIRLEKIEKGGVVSNQKIFQRAYEKEND